MTNPRIPRFDYRRAVEAERPRLHDRIVERLDALVAEASASDFPSGTVLPPQLGTCIYCGHYLTKTDMGNGLVALIPNYGADGFSHEHACTNRDNPGNVHEVAP